MLLKSGTNVAFANGMMHVMIEDGLIDEEFIKNRTEGFEELREIVKEYTPERVAEICHIDPDNLRAAAVLIHFPDGYANILTNAALDEFARIPEYKVCAIRIEKK